MNMHTIAKPLPEPKSADLLKSMLARAERGSVISENVTALLEAIIMATTEDPNNEVNAMTVSLLHLALSLANEGFEHFDHLQTGCCEAMKAGAPRAGQEDRWKTR